MKQTKFEIVTGQKMSAEEWLKSTYPDQEMEIWGDGFYSIKGDSQAKGTMYHEYTHFKGGLEPVAYIQGLINGGRSYFRHCNYAFPNNYKYYRGLYGF